MMNKLNYEVPDMKVLEMSCEGSIATSGNTPGNTPSYTDEIVEDWN